MLSSWHHASHLVAGATGTDVRLVAHRGEKWLEKWFYSEMVARQMCGGMPLSNFEHDACRSLSSFGPFGGVVSIWGQRRQRLGAFGKGDGA